MNYGFVYLLWNEHMPYVVKVGCTERAPHARAEELSKPTGVPAPFQVVCYVELDNFQEAEREFHGWLKEYRISNGREFFDISSMRVAWLMGLFAHHPRKLSFSAPGAKEFLDTEGLGLADVVNPFVKKEEPKPPKLEAFDPEKIAGDAIKAAKDGD